MTTFTIHTDDKELLNALKAFMKALKIKFEMNNDDKPYNAEFVAKLKKAENKQKKEK